jgi:hypothetical protein
MTRSQNLALLALFVPAALCHGEPPRGTDTNFDNHKPLAAGIAKADRVTLYEGLPHEASESGQQELKTKKTVRLHGYPFYAEPLALKESDGKRLTDLVTEASSFAPYRGPKKCGGFHPDYCVEWRVGDEVYRCLVCFGCQEVKLYGPKADLYCDVSQPAYAKLGELLRPYRKQRPKARDE